VLIDKIIDKIFHVVDRVGLAPHWKFADAPLGRCSRLKTTARFQLRQAVNCLGIDIRSGV